MDAKVLEEGKALLEAGAKSGDWPGELSVWLWTHKDELIADVEMFLFLLNDDDIERFPVMLKGTYIAVCDYSAGEWNIVQGDEARSYIRGAMNNQERIDTAIAAGEKK